MAGGEVRRCHSLSYLHRPPAFPRSYPSCWRFPCCFLGSRPSHNRLGPRPLRASVHKQSHTAALSQYLSKRRPKGPGKWHTRRRYISCPNYGGARDRRGDGETGERMRKREKRGGKEENPRHVTRMSVLDSNKNESDRCLNTNRHIMTPAILTSACATPRMPLPCAKPRESAFVARPTSSRIHASQTLSLESPHLQSFYEGKSCLPFHTTLAGPTRFNLTSRSLLPASGRGGPIF